MIEEELNRGEFFKSTPFSMANESLSKPQLFRWLKALKLDKNFFSGQGCEIFHRGEDGEIEKTIDFLGGYGANLFGHSNHFLKQKATDLIQSNHPNHLQLSYRKGAEDLATLLGAKLKNRFQEEYLTLFTNTGTESVELARKCCQYSFWESLNKKNQKNEILLEQLDNNLLTSNLDRRELQFLQNINRTLQETPSLMAHLSGAFHGKTSGSLSNSGNPDYKYKLNGILLPAVELSFSNPDSWKSALQAHSKTYYRFVVRDKEIQIIETPFSSIIGILFEPVQGEGGIRNLNKEQVHALKEIANEFSLPLVADEIQCGMGRTGAFTYCEQIELQPDILLLGKSLGGGYAKIGTVSIRKNIYPFDLDLMHSSTFAEDEFSSQMALATTILADSDTFREKVQETSEPLMKTLKEVERQFPSVVKEVRGAGLMMAIEFHCQKNNPSNLIKMFSSSGYLGYFFSSYLLNQHNIRVGPTLNADHVLRIQPSVDISIAHIEKLKSALECLCDYLQRGHFLGLSQHLVDTDVNISELQQDFRGHIRRPQNKQFSIPKRVGFVCHIPSLSDLKLFDVSLRSLSSRQIADLHKTAEGLVPPCRTETTSVVDSNGETVELGIYGLYESPQSIFEAYSKKSKNNIKDNIQKAFDLAVADGCKVIGLGGLTSVLSRSGTQLLSRGVPMTTGNSLTVGSSIEALEVLARSKNLNLSIEPIAVVGATGNIGRVASLILGEKYPHLMLFGRPGREESLRKTKSELKKLNPRSKVEIHTDLNYLKMARAILSVSNSSEYIIYPKHLSESVQVIVDSAVPSDVSPEVLIQFPEIAFVQGGLISLGKNTDFFVSGIPTPRGCTYACLAETLTLGIRGIDDHFSFGEISPNQVKQITQWHKDAGFSLGPTKFPSVWNELFLESQLYQ